MALDVAIETLEREREVHPDYVHGEIDAPERLAVSKTLRSWNDKTPNIRPCPKIRYR